MAASALEQLVELVGDTLPDPEPGWHTPEEISGGKCSNETIRKRLTRGVESGTIERRYFRRPGGGRRLYYRPKPK